MLIKLKSRRERETENNPIQNCFKKNKIPKKKINQESKRPLLENYKTMKKKIGEDTNK